jgi:hypothetical protein
VKFSGELKFPEIDHPGVPVSFLIEGPQAELVVEGESLGRWSLYDVHARRLVASAFQIDLDGTEVTFVADDPVDFAYRGVEHMAATWATLKSRRIARRTIAVRKSRQGTIPSRIEDMKTAMQANLDAQAAPRQIAGQESMPEPSTPSAAPSAAPQQRDWDRRDRIGAIPLVGSEPVASVPEPEPESTPTIDEPSLTDQHRLLDEERRRIAEERSKLEEERRIAEQREADRIEAYRLEMQRLEDEREELRRQAAELTGATGAEPPSTPFAERSPDPLPEPESSEPEPGPVDEDGSVLDLNDLEEDRARVPSPRRDSPEPPADPPAPAPRPITPAPQPEPAMAGAAKDRSGLMGAVRAAFKSGPRDHDHQFIEAPGGIGITRYVCEECGYVSISV